MHAQASTKKAPHRGALFQRQVSQPFGRLPYPIPSACLQSLRASFPEKFRGEVAEHATHATLLTLSLSLTIGAGVGTAPHASDDAGKTAFAAEVPQHLLQQVRRKAGVVGRGLHRVAGLRVAR